MNFKLMTVRQIWNAKLTQFYFNKEVDGLMGSLKKSSEEKEKLIEKIKAGDPPKVEGKSSDQVEEAEDGEEKRELSEWEKKIRGY